jgi:hypothetical protein
MNIISRDFTGAIQLSLKIKRENFGISTTKFINVNPAFIEAVEKDAKVPINVNYDFQVTDLSVAFWGENRWVILIPEVFNYCHARFALCKELCHILTDDSTTRAKDPTSQILQALKLNRVIQEPDSKTLEPLLDLQPWDSETYCFFLALEIMIPDSRREEMLRLYNLGTPTLDIAHQIKMPETLVAFYFQSRYYSYRQQVLDSLK